MRNLNSGFVASKRRWTVLALCALCACVVGCGGGDEAETASKSDGAKSETVEPTEPKATETPGITLALNLPKHHPIPMLKTVSKTLTQDTKDGVRVSKSWEELLVTLTLEEIDADKNLRIAVNYERVRCRQQTGDTKFEYDSSAGHKNLPWQALPYEGLVGNGFSFWLSPKRRITKLVGFADFLKRCVKRVPADKQQQVLVAFEKLADEGLANFVDDSLGFLPRKPVRKGESWNCDRRFTKPLPLFIRAECKLQKFTDRFAEVDIAGTIATTQTFGPQADKQGVKVLVRGGRCVGQCDIDRETGLPLNSEMTRYVDMTVRQTDGEEFDQKKITKTVIRLFPERSGTAQPIIIPASGTRPTKQVRQAN